MFIPQASQGFPKSTATSVFTIAAPSIDLHNAVDDLEEIELPAHSIGTTRRGIGPACSPHVSSKIITICEVFNVELFERELSTLAASAPEGMVTPACAGRSQITVNTR
ncbi:Adenylosuccinate synthetase like protein [Verticillium longisporum]|uniref:Adenylosuccinate synthetase like protein n=1 Tax=Verticillium longisporum TaxID=100787 RepID=A0A8I2ZQE0_VERLO|nr:Adenylosuccinate synthetase like protein [Verticillium longisporum]